MIESARHRTIWQCTVSMAPVIRLWIVLLPMTSFGDEIPDQAYAITFSDGQRIYTSQCGLNVTTFLLEYYKLDYDLHRTAARLKPDADGITLASIQEVLQAHGLVAEARRGLKVKDLRQPLNSGAMAVIPIKAGTDGAARHYLAAFYDRKRGYLLADVPRAVGPLFEQLNDTDLSEPVILFVRRSQRPLSQQLEVTPKKLELGRFALSEPGGQNPVNSTFRIKNLGATPLVVNVNPTCGCMLPDWTGGFLEPGESREVALRTSPGSWGLGRYIRPIYLSLPDHSRGQIDVAAEAVQAEVLQKFTVTPSNLTIDCTPLKPEGESIERQLDLQFAGGPGQQIKGLVPRLTVTSDAEWLAAQLNSDHSKLVVHIAPSAKLFADRGNEIEGHLRLAADRKFDPVNVRVRLFRRDFFQLNRPVVTVSRSSSSGAELVIEPATDAPGKLECVGFECDNANLVLKAMPGERGETRISISAKPDAAIGQVLIHCKLQCGMAQETALVIAQVTD